MAKGNTQGVTEVSRPRWRPNSVSPKRRKGTRGLKRSVVNERMRGIVQTCGTVDLWEERNFPSKNGGRIYLKGSPEKKLLRPKRIDHEND